MTTPRVIIAPTAEPLTIEECRAHLEAQYYEDSDIDPIDDTMILGFLSAAREFCENFLGLSLATQTLEIALDVFPDDGDGIDLPMGPVREIYSVAWGTESDTEMAAVDYVLDYYRKPNQLRPVASTWPSFTASPNVLKIQYLAGYGVDSDGGEPLPKAIRAAILLMLGHLYEQRQAVNVGNIVTTVDLGVEALLRPLRVRLGMA